MAPRAAIFHSSRWRTKPSVVGDSSRKIFAPCPPATYTIPTNLPHTHGPYYGLEGSVRHNLRSATRAFNRKNPTNERRIVKNRVRRAPFPASNHNPCIHLRPWHRVTQANTPDAPTAPATSGIRLHRRSTRLPACSLGRLAKRTQPSPANRPPHPSHGILVVARF